MSFMNPGDFSICFENAFSVVFFELVSEQFLKLLQFRPDHRSTVALVGVVHVIVLVVGFGWIKCAGGYDLRHDGVLEQLSFCSGLFGEFGQSFLLRRVVEYRRPVLGTNIITLQRKMYINCSTTLNL